MKLRLIFGILLYIIVSGIILFTNEYFLLALVAITLVFLAVEWLNIIKVNKYLLPILLLPGFIIGYLMPYSPSSMDILILSIGCLWYIFAIITIISYERQTKEPKQKTPNRFMGVVNGAIAIAIFIFSTRMLYQISSQFVFICFSLVCVCDSAGYLFGRSIKGANLSPNISPNKTYSGMIGAMLSTIIIYSILTIFFNDLPFNVIAIIMLVPFVMLVQLGDLYQSMLKRRIDIKDSGQIIPGHGGIFDRIDGLLWSPFAFYLFVKLCEFAY